MSKEDELDNGNEDSKFNRRNILKIAGAGALATTSFSGLANAASTEEPQEIDTRQLAGIEEILAIINARSTSDFHQLSNEIENEYDLTMDRYSTKAHELTINYGKNEQERFELITFFTENYQSAKENGELRAEFTICLQDSELIQSEAAVFNTTEAQTAVDNRELIEVVKLSVEGNEVKSELNTVDPSQESLSDEQVSAQIDKCSACRSITRFVCDNGCGLSTTAICLGAGVITSPLGSAVCSAIALVVCDKIDFSEDCKGSALICCRDWGYC